MSWPNGNTFGPRYDVIHPISKKPVKVPDGGWRWSEETFNSIVDYKDRNIYMMEVSYVVEFGFPKKMICNLVQ